MLSGQRGKSTCVCPAQYRLKANIELMSERVIIYSDGGAKPNPGPGGWAALLKYGEHEIEVSGGEVYTTNNQMELTAAIKALEALTRPCEVDFYTDSQYLRQGITEWINGWRKNGWK